MFKQIPSSVEPNSASALIKFKNYFLKRVIVAVSNVSLPRTLVLLIITVISRSQ
jgi:hypothetical protein